MTSDGGTTSLYSYGNSLSPPGMNGVPGGATLHTSHSFSSSPTMPLIFNIEDWQDYDVVSSDSESVGDLVHGGLKDHGGLKEEVPDWGVSEQACNRGDGGEGGVSLLSFKQRDFDEWTDEPTSDKDRYTSLPLHLSITTPPPLTPHLIRTGALPSPYIHPLPPPPLSPLT